MAQKEMEFRIQRNSNIKTDNLNTVYYDDTEGPGGGYHTYFIQHGDTATEIQFQNGPRYAEDSVPGVLEPDLIEIVRHRLQQFQKGPYATRDNACALTHLEEALMWLNKRVGDRAERGVLGSMER